MSGAEGWKCSGVHSSAEIPYQLTESLECFQTLTFYKSIYKTRAGYGRKTDICGKVRCNFSGRLEIATFTEYQEITLPVFLLGTYLDKKMSKKRKLLPNVLYRPFYVTARVISFFIMFALSFSCSENVRRAAYCPCIWRSSANLYLWLLFLQDCCGQRTRPRSALLLQDFPHYPFA